MWLICFMMAVLLLVIEFAHLLSTACNDACNVNLHLLWFLSKQVLALRRCVHNPLADFWHCVLCQLALQLLSWLSIATTHPFAVAVHYLKIITILCPFGSGSVCCSTVDTFLTCIIVEQSAMRNKSQALKCTACTISHSICNAWAADDDDAQGQMPSSSSLTYVCLQSQCSGKAWSEVCFKRLPSF